MFARLADRYDLTNDILSCGIHRRWRRQVVRLAEVRAGERALDVCCGTGDLAMALAAAGAQVAGVDFCPEMVEHAQRKRAGASPSFAVGDALRLPFPDASFDLATVAFGIRNVADPLAGLREMSRVVRPGGRVLVLEFCTPDVPVLGATYRFYFRSVLPRLGALVSGDRHGAYRYLQQTVDAFPQRAQFTALMREAGLREASYRSLSMGIAAIYIGIR